ncbi:MAG TPA: hypothetical protein PL088_13880, partial [Spirochaetota bacterium]|nr:hypothetical protein [Spirochaetota bacterium]
MRRANIFFKASHAADLKKNLYLKKFSAIRLTVIRHGHCIASARITWVCRNDDLITRFSCLSRMSEGGQVPNRQKKAK